MTLFDLEELRPGDSIIGFANRWQDELPIVGVGEVRYPEGFPARREVSVRNGSHVFVGRVIAGGTEIRGVEGRVWGKTAPHRALAHRSA